MPDDAPQEVKAHRDDDDDDEDDSNTSSDMERQRQISRRRLLMTCCSLYTFLFVGSFFGWGPMQLLLEENGSFSWKCHSDDTDTETITTAGEEEQEPCADQTAALLSVSLTGQSTQLLSPLLGLLADRKGAKYAVFLLTAALWSGLGLLVLNAAHPSVVTDRLLYLAFSLLALATWSGGLLTVQTGLYWQGHTKSRVIFILNALFDAGGLTYLLLWFLSNALGLGFFPVMMGFWALSVLIMSLSAYLWIVARPEKAKFKVENDDDDDRQAKEEKESSQKGNQNEPEPGSLEIAQSARQQQQHPIPSTVDENSDYVLVADRTTRQQLSSRHFLLLCSFFGIHCGQNQWNLTTQRDFLAYLGDNEVGNKYLTIFTLLTPVSILGLPFVDRVILRFGFAGGLQCINLLALVYNIVKLSSSNLNVQIIGFVVFSFYRCFLFGVTFSFLPTMIGHKLVGKATGCMYSIAAVASLLNIPLSQIAVKSLEGNFFIPNLIVTFLMAPCAFMIYVLNRLMIREKTIRQRRQTIELERLRQSYGGARLHDDGNDDDDDDDQET